MIKDVRLCVIRSAIPLMIVNETRSDCSSADALAPAFKGANAIFPPDLRAAASTRVTATLRDFSDGWACACPACGGACQKQPLKANTNAAHIKGRMDIMTE